MTALSIACTWCFVLPGGCGPTPPKPQTVTTQPAPAPQRAAAAAPKPLPARAMVSLDGLQPVLARPENPPDAGQVPARALELVAEAEKHLEKRDYTTAAKALERAAGFDPANARTQFLLGRAYLGLRNRGKAIASLQAATRTAPDNLEAQLLLGQLAAAQRQIDDAVRRLRTALKCSDARADNPLSGEALLTLGLILEREGYWTAALEGYGKLGDWIDAHGPEYAARPALRDWVVRPERLQSRQGALLMLLRRPKDAAGLLRRAHRRNRSDRRTARLLVEALLALKQYPEVETLLMEMTTQPAQRGQVPLLVSMLCDASGDQDLPQRFWKAFRAGHEADASLAIALAKAAHRQGWDEQALSLLDAVRALKPADEDLWRTLCRIYARRKEPEDLAGLIDEALSADPAPLEALTKAMPEAAAVAPKPNIGRRFALAVRQRTSKARPALLYLAGRLATARGKHLLAADLYRDAIDAKGDFLEAYEALLETYIAQGRADRVDRLLEQVARLAKGTYLPPYLRGKVELSRGRTNEAIDGFEEALRVRADHLPSQLLLATAYRVAGRLSSAVKTLLAALKAHPDEADIYRELFRIYAARGRLRDARSLVQSLLRRHPDSTAAQLMLAELALLAGRRDEALRLLAQLEKRSPEDSDVGLLSVRAILGPRPGLVSKSDFEEASAKLSAVIRAQPGNREARERLAELLAAVDKTAEAAGVWATLYEESPADRELARKYVAALLRAKQHATALRVVERFRQDHPDVLWARLAVVGLLGELKRTDEVRRLAEDWIRKAKENTAKILYRQELLRVLEAGKHYEQALAVVDNWLAGNPQAMRRRTLRYSKVTLLGLRGQFDQAKALADELLREDPNSLAPRLLVGAAVETKQYDKILRVLDAWIQKPGKAGDLFRTLKVLVYAEAKQYEQARRQAEAWRKDAPKALPARKLLLSVLAQAKLYDEADRVVAAWRKDLLPSTAPTQPAALSETARWVLETSARLKVTREKYADGLQLAEEALKLDPKNTELMSLRSACLSELGRHDEAVAALEDALKIKPDDPGLNNNLGYLYAERGIQLRRAERLLQKALVRRPTETAFRDSLGWIHYKQGRFREAGREFQRLVRDRTDEQIQHGVILDHAGDVYYRLGWKDEAINLWKRAMKLAREDERPSREVRQVLTGAAAKIEAARKGRPPALAPLGEAEPDQPAKPPKP